MAGYKDWQSRQAKIAAFIDSENPDILLLQEVRFDPAYSYYSQSSLLNAQLSHPFAHTQTTVSKFYQPSIGDAYREGLAVLSRFPIANSEALVLRKQADDKHSRIVQNADLLINGRQVRVTNVHLSNNQHSPAQFKELLAILSQRKEARVIVGDFNIFNLESERELYFESYVSSSEFKKYLSFPSESATLDYALIRRIMSLFQLKQRRGFPIIVR